MTTSEAGPPAMPPEVPQPTQPPVSWTPAAPSEPGPAPGLRFAGFWVRTVAYIIDLIIVAVIGSALSVFFGAPTITSGPSGLEIDYASQGPSALVTLLYFIGFWVWRSQTPGMLVFNMRVVRADTGEGIDVVRGILRYVGLIISFVVLLLGVIWVAFDGRKQGWHDKLAGTVVVRPT
jgi:uncharacterized RDD family membrane protein YckC